MGAASSARPSLTTPGPPRVTYPDSLALVIFLVLLVAGAALWWFLSQRALFKLSIRNGEVLVVSGRVPIRFLQDVRDVIRDEKLESGTVSAVARDHGAGLSFWGIPEGPQQRMRNAFRLYPIAEVRHAPPIARPSIGQMLGIAWLAWLIEGRLRR